MKSGSGQVKERFPKIDAFPERVEFLIKMHGSASEVARLSGSSDTVVRKWRNGESDPSRERCIALAKGTGAPLQWLMTGEPPETAPRQHSQSVSWNIETLVDAIEAVDTGLAMLDAGVTMEERAHLYVSVYEYLLDDTTTAGQAAAGVLRLIQGGRR